MVDRLTRPEARTLVLLAAASVAVAAAWVGLAGATRVAVPHAHGADLGAFVAAVVMWQAMIVAMMTPTVLPWLATYARLVAPGDASTATWRSIAGFAGGYFIVWLAYGIVAAGAQIGLQAAGLVGHDGAVPARAGGVVLLMAGGAQFLPARQACLTHCRNPLSYFLARWRNGPVSGFSLGVAHGAWCVGCCWLIMATGFAIGLMNLAWMALLTIVLAAEQTLPGGVWVGRVFGAALTCWGAWLVIQPGAPDGGGAY